MSEQTIAKGRCLCGSVTYDCRAAPLWSLYCHCESCRLNTGSPATAFFGIADDCWSWTGAEPGLYESGPGIRRYFCRTCGTPTAYAADKFPGETHFYTAALFSTEGFEPTGHVHAAERLAWFDIHDRLPRWTDTLGGQKIER